MEKLEIGDWFASGEMESNAPARIQISDALVCAKRSVGLAGRVTTALPTCSVFEQTSLYGARNRLQVAA